MHAHEKPAGDVDKGIVRGKYNVCRPHVALRRMQAVAFRAYDGRVFINFQFRDDRLNEFERVKLRLTIKAHRAFDGKGQFCVFSKKRRDAQTPRRLRLPFKRRFCRL